jgi:hypothetical protein
MVSANYAAQGSALAKKIGLGQKVGNGSKHKAAKSKTDMLEDRVAGDRLGDDALDGVSGRLERGGVPKFGAETH